MLREIAKDQPTESLRKMPFNLELSAARNEVHYVDLGDFNTGDSFTLTYDGQTTSAINYNGTPATVAGDMDTAIESLSNRDTVTVAHVSAQIYSVTYTGTEAGLTLNLPTITPTGFTPTGVTREVTGGVINAPAIGDSISSSDLTISKNGGAFAGIAGTVTEIGGGLYEYVPTVGEIDTEGYAVLSLNKAGLAAALFLYQINSTSQINGETIIATGTAQAGDAATITLASGASGNSNQYIPCRIDITSGTGNGQGGRLGFAYNGSTKVLSVEPPWVTVPDNTSVYKLTSVVPSMADSLRVNHQISGTFGGDLAEPGDIIDEFLDRSSEVADSLLDADDGVETGLTQRQALRLLISAMAGKLSGGGTTTITIRDYGDTKNRITATVDSNGNRSAITADPD